MPRARGQWSCVAALALAACATPFDNAPLNVPLSPPSTPAFVAPSGSPPPPDPSGGANVIALSLSGGGMRAAVFAFGVLQALQGGGPTGMDVFDELTFISADGRRATSAVP